MFIKRLMIAFLIFISPAVYAADVTRSHDFTDGEVLTAAMLDTAFDEIVNELNDIDSDNLASNLAITTSGAVSISGTFTATGSSINLGNGADTLTINASGGIVFTPAATWTFSASQTVSGTWANIGTITTADINGGTIDGVTIGGSAAPTVTNLGSVATADMNGGTIDAMTIGVSSPSTAIFTTAMTTGNVGIGTYSASGGRLMVQGGNVGIGTLNANETLTVVGKVYSTSGGFKFPDNTIQTTRYPTEYSAGTYLIGGPGIFKSAYDPGDNYIKIDEIYVPRAGTLTVKFWLGRAIGGATVYGKIYRNGVAVGTEQSTSGSGTEASEDIAGWSIGDLCQLYVKTEGADTANFGAMRLFENAPDKEVVATVSNRPPMIFWGTGVPAGTLCTNIGDLFLRQDGSTSTTLYVCTASSTWTAK